jgi:protein translocase SecG subunit
VISYILTTLYVLACFVLILFVLLQPGKSDAAAVFGGGVNSAAFGPRGTQTVLAKVTITAAIIFFLIAFLFSIPGLFERKSLGEGVGAAEPAAPAPVSTPATPDTTTPAAGGPQNAAQPSGGNAGNSTTGAKSSNASQKATNGKKPDNK